MTIEELRKREKYVNYGCMLCEEVVIADRERHYRLFKLIVKEANISTDEYDMLINWFRGKVFFNNCFANK